LRRLRDRVRTLTTSQFGPEILDSSEWRQARRYLLDIDVGALWYASTVEEQREILGALFSKIVAARDRLIFHVRGIEFPVEIPWQQQGPEGPGPSAALNEVAGAGFEPATFGL
jgi:hypothetical protein